MNHPDQPQGSLQTVASVGSVTVSLSVSEAWLSTQNIFEFSAVIHFQQLLFCMPRTAGPAC